MDPPLLKLLKLCNLLRPFPLARFLPICSAAAVLLTSAISTSASFLCSSSAIKGFPSDFLSQQRLEETIGFAIAKDLLADIPDSVDVQSVPTQPKSKTKRIKKAQPKANVTQIDTEDTLPISKLASSEKTTSAAEKRPAEAQQSESPKSKRPRSFATTTSGSLKHDAPWAPQVTLEDKPVKASDSADDINVGVTLSTALLLPGDLDRNTELSEYENYALMLQRSVQAIQHAHSFSIQSFENWKELVDKKREVTSLQRANKSLQSKMKKLEDQGEVAIKVKDDADEKTGAAEAINKVLEAQRKEFEEKMAQAQKELQDALATKDAELKAADEKGYNEGAADVISDYEKNADVIPLLFPPIPTQSDDESESEEETLGEEAPKDATPEKASSDVPLADKSLDLTVQEIDAELAVEKVAEMSSQQSSEIQTQPANDAEES
ncbi:enolase-phosphatase E1-like [Camellia sinensis]|uniref:enolase-phosphatase E1-like n=1 Tax=Camellia sinensis TaxID=4442 RepID=UPI0010368A8E|nr:enolase-phosphatase E1-like [Camellia sinensis]